MGAIMKKKLKLMATCINGHWVVVDAKDNIVWIDDSEEACNEKIQSGEIESAMEMCKYYC